MLAIKCLKHKIPKTLFCAFCSIRKVWRKVDNHNIIALGSRGDDVTFKVQFGEKLNILYFFSVSMNL